MTEHDEPLDERSDADLLALARTGDTVASDVLWVRTWPSALAVARFVADDPADAEDLASEAMTAVFGAISRGAGPTDVVRAYVGTTIRNLHATDLRRRSRTGRPVELDDERVLRVVADEPDVVESALVGKAFRGLPDRWRYVLWATLVEGRDGEEVAVTLDIKPAAVYALKARALEGLRQQYLTEHALEGREQECATVHRSLASTVRGRNRREADTQRVWQHLRGCTHCAEGYREMTALNTKLGALVGPAVGGLAVLGAGTAKLGLLEGIRLAGSGARYGVAAATVAGAVAVTTAVVGIHQLAPADVIAVPAVRSTAAAATAAPTAKEVARPAPAATLAAVPVPTATKAPRPTTPTCHLTRDLVPGGALDAVPGLGLDGIHTKLGPVVAAGCAATLPTSVSGALPDVPTVALPSDLSDLSGLLAPVAKALPTTLPTTVPTPRLVTPKDLLKNPLTDSAKVLPTAVPGLSLP